MIILTMNKLDFSQISVRQYYGVSGINKIVNITTGEWPNFHSKSEFSLEIDMNCLILK